MYKYLTTLLLLIAILSSCDPKESEVLPEEKISYPSQIGNGVIDTIIVISSPQSPYVDPEIYFNHPVEQKIRHNDGGEYRYIISSLKAYILGEEFNALSVAKVADDRKSLTFSLPTLPKPNSVVAVEIQLQWQVKQDESWVDLIQEGELIKEVKEETAELVYDLKYELDVSNIEASYPAPGQYNFHWQEYSKGYIKLYRDQDWWKTPEEGGELEVIIKQKEGYSKTLPVSYSPEEKLFTFSMPTNLLPETVYSFVYNYIEGGTTYPLQETTFRTSKYSTFKEKHADMVFAETGNRMLIYTGTHSLTSLYETPELFDSLDLNYSSFDLSSWTTYENIQSGFVRLEADFDNTEFYINVVYPRVYQPVNMDLFELTDSFVERDTSEVGYPPKEALFIDQEVIPVLSEEVIQAGVASSTAGTGLTNFGIIDFIRFDFNRIYDAIAKELTYGNKNILDDERIETIYNYRSFGSYRDGTYSFTVNYFLPGLNIYTFRSEPIQFVSN